MFSFVGTRSTHTFMLSFMKCSQSACTMQQWSKRLVAPASKENAKHIRRCNRYRGWRVPLRVAYSAPELSLQMTTFRPRNFSWKVLTPVCSAARSRRNRGLQVKSQTRLVQWTESRGP